MLKARSHSLALPKSGLTGHKESMLLEMIYCLSVSRHSKSKAREINVARVMMHKQGIVADEKENKSSGDLREIKRASCAEQIARVGYKQPDAHGYKCLVSCSTVVSL